MPVESLYTIGISLTAGLAIQDLALARTQIKREIQILTSFCFAFSVSVSPTALASGM